MGKIIGKSTDWLRDQDQIVQPFDTFLHGGDIKSTTLFGGITSLCCKLYVIYIGIDKAIQMFGRDGPNITSMEVTY